CLTRVGALVERRAPLAAGLSRRAPSDRPSTLLEQPLKGRRVDAVLLAAVVAGDLEGRAVLDHGLDLVPIEGGQRGDQTRLAAPALEAHRRLVRVRKGHPVERLVAQAHGGKVVAQLTLDAPNIFEALGHDHEGPPTNFGQKLY